MLIQPSGSKDRATYPHFDLYPPAHAAQGAREITSYPHFDLYPATRKASASSWNYPATNDHRSPASVHLPISYPSLNICKSGDLLYIFCNKVDSTYQIEQHTPISTSTQRFLQLMRLGLLCSTLGSSCTLDFPGHPRGLCKQLLSRQALAASRYTHTSICTQLNHRRPVW